MPNSTIVDKLSHSAQLFPNKSAFRFINNDESEQSLTFSELLFKSQKIATFLTNLGTTQDRVILLLNPGIDYILALFGTLAARQIPVTLYLPRPKVAASILYLFRDAKPRFCLTTRLIMEQYKPILEQAVKEFGLVVILLEDIWLTTTTNILKLFPTSLEDIAFLQYTSGSTGSPKAVIISHANLMDNLIQIQNKFQSTHEDIGVFWLPPYHDMGLVGAIFEPVFLGMSVTLMSPMNFIQRPFRWLDEISKTRATVSGGPNFAFDLCTQRISEEQLSTLDLSSLRLIFSGAERIRYKTFENFLKKFSQAKFNSNALYFCYGMAESTLIISGDFVRFSSMNHDQGTPVLSCGTPLQNMLVKIVNPDTFHPLPDQEIGEIYVQSPSVASGYWRNEKASRDTFLGKISNIPGYFLKTGDIGFMKGNQLFVTGRIKEMIILNGKNYFPNDIEHCVSEVSSFFHSGGIAAFSTDDTYSEKLIIICEILRTKLSQLNETELKMDIQEALSKCFQIACDDIVFVLERSIPRTSSGKLKRLECKSQFESNQLKRLDVPKLISVE